MKNIRNALHLAKTWIFITNTAKIPLIGAPVPIIILLLTVTNESTFQVLLVQYNYQSELKLFNVGSKITIMIKSVVDYFYQGFQLY